MTMSSRPAASSRIEPYRLQHRPASGSSRASAAAFACSKWLRSVLRRCFADAQRCRQACAGTEPAGGTCSRQPPAAEPSRRARSPS